MVPSQGASEKSYLKTSRLINQYVIVAFGNFSLEKNLSLVKDTPPHIFRAIFKAFQSGYFTK